MLAVVSSGVEQTGGDLYIGYSVMMLEMLRDLV
jgi:hypothetical protein